MTPELESIDPAFTLPISEVHSALQDTVFRVNQTLDQTGDLFPYVCDPKDGHWETTGDPDWCGGDWIGSLLIAARHTQDKASKNRLLAAAERAFDRQLVMKKRLSTSMFSGPNGLHSGYRYTDETGDPRGNAFGQICADHLVNLYNEKAQQVASGIYRIAGPAPKTALDKKEGQEGWITSGWAASAVDSIHLVAPLLYRAHRETGETIYKTIADQHNEVYLGRFIREDGSTRQKVGWDPETGNFLKEYFDLAYSNETCWARGLGWCISGLASSWNATQEKCYADALEKTVSFYIRNAPEDWVCYWDPLCPDIPHTERDTSAAGVIAYGLVQLQNGDERIPVLRAVGLNILQGIYTHYMIRDEESPLRGAITDGCYNRTSNYATRHELIWTDYYVLSALDYLTKTV
jgi:unsaturated chondroitin disaccharide hydrolase